MTQEHLGRLIDHVHINGGPGLRRYHAHYYAAFLLDPDGHNIEAVHHGPAQRSAASVTVDRA